MIFNLSNLVIAILIIFLVIIFASSYEIVKPESTVAKYSFTPFPNVAPVDIPDANIGASANCTNRLKTCTQPGSKIGCEDCGDDFMCENVQEGQNVIVNGNPIKINPLKSRKDEKHKDINLCLPKGFNNINSGYGCNLNTGRAVWSATAKGGSPGWTCDCLYPELFDGPSCSTFVGCSDPNDDGVDVIKDLSKKGANPGKNQLVNLLTGEPYDINNPDGENPYELNDDKTPKYGCTCDAGSFICDGTINGCPKGEVLVQEGIKQYVKLPGDNMRCHLDPCSKYTGDGTIPYTIPFWNAERKRCKCNKGDDKFAFSDKKGICFTLPEDACGKDIQGGVWEYSSNPDEAWYGKGGCKCNDCTKDPSLKSIGDDDSEDKSCAFTLQKCDSEFISHSGEKINDFYGGTSTPNCPQIGEVCSPLCTNPYVTDANGQNPKLCSMPGDTVTGTCCVMSAKWRSDSKDGPCYNLVDPVTGSTKLDPANSIDGKGSAYCNCKKGVDNKNYSGLNCTKWCYDDDQKLPQEQTNLCCNSPTGFENTENAAGWGAKQCGHHGNFLKGIGGNLIGGLSHTFHQIKKCFGSETKLNTISGERMIWELKEGDEVLTWNLKSNAFEYQPVLYIRKHENIGKSKMTKITTSCGDNFILTSDHRIYLDNNESKKIEDLNYKETLKTLNGNCYIVNKEEYVDIPLSPILLNGNVVTSGGTIISCWSGDDKNVIFMEKLMKLTKEYIKTHSIEETKNIMRIVYEKCLKTNKNLSSLTSILKELSLNNYIKYL